MILSKEDIGYISLIFWSKAFEIAKDFLFSRHSGFVFVICVIIVLVIFVIRFPAFIVERFLL